MQINQSFPSSAKIITLILFFTTLTHRSLSNSRVDFPNPAPPSGCQELPGTRRENHTHSASPSPPPPSSSSSSPPQRQQSRCECRCCCYCRCCHTYCRNASSGDAAGERSCCCGRTSAGEHVATRCRAGGTEETGWSGDCTAAEGAKYTGGDGKFVLFS